MAATPQDSGRRASRAPSGAYADNAGYTSAAATTTTSSSESASQPSQLRLPSASANPFVDDISTLGFEADWSQARQAPLAPLAARTDGPAMPVADPLLHGLFLPPEPPEPLPTAASAAGGDGARGTSTHVAGIDGLAAGTGDDSDHVELLDRHPRHSSRQPSRHHSASTTTTATPGPPSRSALAKPPPSSSSVGLAGGDQHHLLHAVDESALYDLEDPFASSHSPSSSDDEGGGGGSGGMSMDGLGRTSSSDNLDMRTAHRRRGRRRTRAEKLPEQEFLKLVAAQTDIDVIRTMVGRRVEYLASHDYADRMTKMPFWQIALSRCPAIILTLTLELVVGAVIHKYAGLIKNNMMITSFMPVLSSIAGNVGLQASTATLRALSTGHASGSDLSGVYHILIKEFLASLVVASLSGIVLLSIAWSWAHSLQFGITTALGIFFNSSIAGIMGCLGPLTFKALRIDPALMAGPFETAMQDLIGSSVYLGIAAALLPWEP